MTDNNSTKPSDQDSIEKVTDAATPRQIATASSVPFVLRAWWLREFEEYKDFDWCGETQITGPLWSNFSDPLCDCGSLDFGF
jgi:hypothetical protein